MQKLLHYSHKPLRLEKLENKSEQDRPIDFKPVGLWVSVGEGWAAAVQAMGIEREHGLDFVCEVKLKPVAQILRLKTMAEISEFSQRFKADDVLPSSRLGHIKWHAVAAAYQGIIVAPYYRTRDMDFFWLWSWDCASGCVWDVSAVASLKARDMIKAEES